MTNKFILTKLKTQIATKFKSQNVIQTSNSYHKKKSSLRETKNISTDADSRTDTILERLRDLSERKKKKYISSKIIETIFLQNLWNYFLPKSLKLSSSKNFETIFLQNLWNKLHPKSLKQFSSKIFRNFSSKIFETNFLQNLWKYFLKKSLKQILSEIFERIFLKNVWN